MSHLGLIGAVLYTKDLRRLVEFYTAVTGVQLRSMEDGFAVLGGESSQFVIVRIPEHIADSISIEAPPAPRETTPVKLVFAVADIAAARRSATPRGGAVKPSEHEWIFEGATVCDGYDPEGNVFQLRVFNES